MPGMDHRCSRVSYCAGRACRAQTSAAHRLAQPAAHHGRDLRGRRHHRHRRAHHRHAAFRGPEATDRHRKRRRRRRHDRRGARRESPGGRLPVRAGQCRHPRPEPDALQESVSTTPRPILRRSACSSICRCCMVSRTDAAAQRSQEFIAYAKANQAKMQYGSAGTGAPTHLACALLNVAMGVNITHVPYRGSALALQDMIAGRIDYHCLNRVGRDPAHRSARTPRRSR